MKVLASRGPLGHESQPPPSFVGAAPGLRLVKVSTGLEVHSDPRRASLRSPVPKSPCLVAPPPPGRAALDGTGKDRGFWLAGSGP